MAPGKQGALAGWLAGWHEVAQISITTQFGRLGARAPTSEPAGSRAAGRAGGRSRKLIDLLMGVIERPSRLARARTGPRESQVGQRVGPPGEVKLLTGPKLAPL